MIAYRVLLRLCPPELRRFEPEMTEVFELQLADARREAGWPGVLEVWWRALAEVLCMALPRQVIPALSLTASAAIFVGLTWALENPLAMLTAYHQFVNKFGG